LKKEPVESIKAAEAEEDIDEDNFGEDDLINEIYNMN
jgi:hypothetical protein